MAQIETLISPPAPPGAQLSCKHHIALCHQKTGRHEEAVRLLRLVYAKRKAQEDQSKTLDAGLYLARSLVELRRYAEAKSLVLRLLRGLEPGGEYDPKLSSEYGPKLRQAHAEALYKPATASRDEVFEAATTLEDILSALRKRFGAGHPDTVGALAQLDRARMTLEDKFQQ